MDTANFLDPAFPFHLLELISSNLDITSYCRFRSTCKRILELDHIPTLTCEAFKKSVEHALKKERDPIVLQNECSKLDGLFSLYCTSILRCHTILIAPQATEILADWRVDPTPAEALYHAATRGDLDCIHALLRDPRIDPSPHGNDGIRPLAAASNEGHLAVVRALLLDSRVDPGADTNTAIQRAAMNGHLEIVRTLLLDSRVDPSTYDNYALCSAAEQGHFHVVQALLDDWRVDPSARDSCVLGYAAQHGNLEIVGNLLQDSRVDPGARRSNALRLADRNGHQDVVKVLLEDPRVDPSVISETWILKSRKARTRGENSGDSTVSGAGPDTYLDFFLMLSGGEG